MLNRRMPNGMYGGVRGEKNLPYSIIDNFIVVQNNQYICGYIYFLLYYVLFNRGDVMIEFRDIYNIGIESNNHHDFHGKSIARKGLMRFIASLDESENDYEDVISILEDEAEYQGFVYGFIVAMDLLNNRCQY